MNTIHRFDLTYIGDSKVLLSPEHRLLGVIAHPVSGLPTLHAIVNPEVHKTATVTIRGIMTGEDFDEKAEHIGKFLSTVILEGNFIVHYFLVE